jgi:hypothetical protein
VTAFRHFMTPYPCGESNNRLKHIFIQLLLKGTIKKATFSTICDIYECTVDRARGKDAEMTNNGQ